MEFRVCSKCYVEKPLTTDYFGVAQKNKARLHTECLKCKKKYMKEWNQKRRAELDIDRKRDKHMYEIKEMSEEEKRDRLMKAYAHIYNEAFDDQITLEELERLVD